MSIITQTYGADDLYVTRLFIGGTQFIPPGPIIGTNTFYGELSGSAITTGTNNSGFGYLSLRDVTTGSRNTAFGANTLTSITGPDAITALGEGIAPLLDGATNGLIMVGSGILATQTDMGLTNLSVLIGNDILINPTASVNGTVFVGHSICRTGVSALNAVVVGNGNLQATANLQESIVIGADNAIVGNNSVINSVVMSVGLPATLPTIDSLTLISINGLRAATAVTGAVVIGYNTCTTLADASQGLVVMGTGTLTTATAVTNSVVLGSGTITGAATVTDVAAVGSGSLVGTTTATNIVLLGNDSLVASTVVTNTTAVGNGIFPAGNISDCTLVGNAIGSLSTATVTDIVVVGSDTFTNITASSNAIAVGRFIKSAGSVSDCIFLGNRVAENVTISLNPCIAIGNNVMQNAGADSGSNIAIGESALASVTGPYNTVIGHSIGSAITATSDENVLIGYTVHSNSTQIRRSTVIGTYAQSAIVDPTTDSTIIGYNTLLASAAANVVALGAAITLSSALVTAASCVVIGNTAKINGTSNVTIGNLAGNASASANNLVLIGQGIAVGSTVIGDRTVAIGSGAYNVSTSAVTNTVVGSLAASAGTALGAPITTLERCVAIGTRALRGTTVTDNVAIGVNTLDAVGTVVFAPGPFVVTNNVGIGNGIGGQMVTFTDNVVVGQGSVQASSLNPRTQNTVCGGNTLSLFTNGTQNTTLGFGCGAGLTTINQNTYLGAESTSPDATTNATAIGYQAVAPASNSVRLGNTAVTLIETQVAITVTSDARVKENIQDLRGDIVKIRGLLSAVSPKIFTLKGDETATRRTGVLAQELDKAIVDSGLPVDIVQKPKGDDINAHGMWSVRYDDLFTLLLAGYQDIALRLDALEKKI